MKSSNIKKVKIVLFIMVVLIFVILAISLFPVMKNLASPEGQVEFKNKVDELGILGYLMIFGIQFAQIFLIIVPGEPVEVLAGMCYGVLGGTMYVLVSAGIISMMIFGLVRKYGRNFILNFFEEDSLKKIEDSKLFSNPKKIEYTLLILFFIPGTPKDLLVYLSGLLPIKPFHFLLITVLGRIPSVISSTIAGANLAVGAWKISIIAYGITFISVAIIILIINGLDKENVKEINDKLLKNP